MPKRKPAKKPAKKMTRLELAKRLPRQFSGGGDEGLPWKEMHAAFQNGWLRVADLAIQLSQERRLPDGK